MTRIRLKYSIQDLAISEDEINFKYKIDHELAVRLFEPDKEYKKKSKSPFIIFCDAELQIQPNKKNYDLLNDIIDGKVVKDKLGIPAPFTELKNHEGKDIIIPPLQILPEHFQDFLSQIKSELDKAIRNTISTLRWFYNNDGRHNPFAYRDFEFTNDNINWYPLPFSVFIDIESQSRKIQIKKTDTETILSLNPKQPYTTPPYMPLSTPA